MTLFLKILAVGAGGGLGAMLRHLLIDLFHGALAFPTFGAVMVVNAVGSFFIGLAFLIIEASYRRDGNSRLNDLPIAQELDERVYWPEGDPTLPAVDLFQFNIKAEVLAGFIITGLLGGMTTFSLFSLLSLNLLQGGAPGWALFNAIGSVALGFFAAGLGFRAGKVWISR